MITLRPDLGPAKKKLNLGVFDPACLMYGEVCGGMMLWCVRTGVCVYLHSHVAGNLHRLTILPEPPLQQVQRLNRGAPRELRSHPRRLQQLATGAAAAAPTHPRP